MTEVVGRGEHLISEVGGGGDHHISEVGGEDSPDTLDQIEEVGNGDRDTSQLL